MCIELIQNENTTFIKVEFNVILGGRESSAGPFEAKIIL